MPTAMRHNRQPQEGVKVLMYSIGQEQQSWGEGPRYVTPLTKMLLAGVTSLAGSGSLCIRNRVLHLAQSLRG